MGSPFGDYWMAGYSVQAGTSEIRLRAERNHPGAPHVTEIVFSGVAAYHFEHDNFGTILGHIIEHPLAAFIEQHADIFSSGSRQSGWPTFWNDSVEDAVAFLESSSVRAFELSSSYGMAGWVLARDFQTCALDDEPS